jgi:hypothetical protein
VHNFKYEYETSHEKAIPHYLSRFIGREMTLLARSSDKCGTGYVTIGNEI